MSPVLTPRRAWSSRPRGARAARAAMAPVLLVVALTAAACSSGGYAATPVPTPASTTATASAPKPPRQCVAPLTALTSYAPGPPGAAAPALPASTDRVLRVGISADSLLLGARNPRSAQIEGFDIDVARAVASAVGNGTRLQLVVIRASDRIPLLQAGTLDMVARNMSMTCDRWADIDFSAEYYQARLKLLVPEGRQASAADLKGKRVCAPSGTTTLDWVGKNLPDSTAVGARDHTSCLVLFRASQVDAIAGDDAVLAGLAAQDPYATVPQEQPAGTSVEHYGLGFPKDAEGSTRSVEFVRFVNRLLEDMKADGRWKALYDKWFAPSLGPAPTPPRAVYGRS